VRSGYYRRRRSRSSVPLHGLLIPNAFMRKQASMIDLRCSRSFAADIHFWAAFFVLFQTAFSMLTPAAEPA
jgi:hypothetical protein